MEQSNNNMIPKAIGPYQVAVRAGNLLFCSGQIPLEPATGIIAGATTAEQSEQVIKNIKAVLQQHNLSLADVRKTACFLQSLNDFEEFNEVYARHFTEPYPARSCVEAARLPKGVLVEIEVIAEFPQGSQN